MKVQVAEAFQARISPMEHTNRRAHPARLLLP